MIFYETLTRVLCVLTRECHCSEMEDYRDLADHRGGIRVAQGQVNYLNEFKSVCFAMSLVKATSESSHWSAKAHFEMEIHSNVDVLQCQ